MILEERLRELNSQMQEAINKLNTLEQQKQQLLPEVLRLEGKIQIVSELIKEQNKGD